jgi:transposase-like protein
LATRSQAGSATCTDGILGRRTVDQFGQVIDVLVSVPGRERRSPVLPASAGHVEVTPTEVVSDAAAVYPAVLDELIPSAWHHLERYANNRIEADHSQLKRRLRPMRGLRTDRSAAVIIGGHAFMENLRRGHFEIGRDVPLSLRVAAAFTELAQAI